MSHESEQISQAPLEEIDPSTSLLQEVLRGRLPLEHIRDPEKRQRAEQTQAAMETVAVSLHDLHELSHDDQLEVLDRVVDTVFDADEDAQDTIAKIQAAREARDEDAIKSLTKVQKERYVGMRRDIANSLGVEIEDTAKEDEVYRARLLDTVSHLEGASEEEIMRTLGFLKLDPETGKERFSFPEDVFPPHIVSKWKNYEQTIKDHVAASMRFNRALDDNSHEVVQLDALRRYAHNNLAKSVQEFLLIDNWDFERVRKFITKLVEQRFPTIETMESQVTSEAVVSRLRAIRTLGKVGFHGHEEEEEEAEEF